MRLAGIEIGPDQPCRFIAELSNNHNGSLDLARRLILAAKDAGADVIKTQCYTPDELVALRGDGPAPEPWGSQGWTMLRLYEKAQTPLAWFPDLVALCHELELPWFSSVFGPESLTLLESLHCPVYKLASLDKDASDLLHRVLDTGKPVVRSLPTGQLRGFPSPFLHLYCPPGYPQPRVALRRLREGGFDGFSYHGTNPGVPVLAAAMGAQLVECHLQLEDEPSALEKNVSLTEGQFRVMVTAVRANEALAR